MRTQLLCVIAPEDRVGRAEARGGSHGIIRWSIQPAGDGSWVEVHAEVHVRRTMDALLMSFGGRRWLARGRRGLTWSRLVETSRYRVDLTGLPVG